jgi:hypothetical protein
MEQERPCAATTRLSVLATTFKRTDSLASGFDQRQTALEGCGGTAKSTTPPRLLSDHDMMSFIRDGFLMLPLDELRRSPGQVRLGGQDRSVSAKQVQISYCAQSNLHTNLKSGPRKQAVLRELVDKRWCPITSPASQF